jgi:DNA-binding transcriptional MerR regulator
VQRRHIVIGSVDDVRVDEQLLTIGAFSRRSRLSLKALRLYERLGLLSPAVVDPANGYRRYRESQLFTARLIVGLRRLDMPLSDIARVISAPGEVGAEAVESYWAGVERHVASQRELAERLGESLRGADARFAEFAVRQREVADMVVLSEKRAVDLPDLRTTINAAIARLTRRAADHGGLAGGPLIFFHGEVNEDSDGPVEVCIPVRTASAATRCEPAHREAYVTVIRAQWEWPQILSAYDAVEAWIDRNGQVAVGSPREIYRAGIDPASSTATDEVCEVAFPIA